MKTAVEIKKGLSKELELGNMDSYRDWGHSKDYVRAMHMILNSDKPDNYVVAAGKTYSVKEMVEYVFEKLDLDFDEYVFPNPKYLRPEELPYLRILLNLENFDWKPEYTFATMLDEMIAFWNNELS